MAPELHIIWGNGAPGEPTTVPGLAQSYRLCRAHAHIRVARISRLRPRSGAFLIQVSQVNKMKRGHYVYQA